MGEIILKFDSVEEGTDARTALDGYKWKLAMWDLDQKLRSITKYGASVLTHDNQASSIEQDVAEKLREEIREILNGYNINLED
jgi:hypothetical protein